MSLVASYLIHCVVAALAGLPFRHLNSATAGPNDIDCVVCEFGFPAALQLESVLNEIESLVDCKSLPSTE